MVGPKVTVLPALAKALQLNGSPTTTIPRLVYGTAWKKERTADLVYEALKAGFRGVDTAAQPRHYQEDLVGEGIRRAIAEGLVSRKDLYVQTKFTSPRGQDLDNMPYDPNAPLEDQITKSVASSLIHLKTSDSEPYIDCLVLHSPLDTFEKTLRAFEILKEKYVPQHIRHLGISNVPLEYVEKLGPDVLAVVQNRFHGQTAFEVEMRSYCRLNGIIFQTFWTLTGNPRILQNKIVADLAADAGVSKEVAFYALVLGLKGTTILDGTTNPSHMREDLDGIVKVGAWAESAGEQAWGKSLAAFREAIGEVD